MSNAAPSTQGVFVFGSPVAVGHVQPLVPLARRLVERGYGVVWAISGDPNELAARWREPLERVGVEFVDLDAVAPFDALTTDTTLASLTRRILGRANVVTAAAAEAVRAAVGGRTIVAGVYDYFALWAYTAMRRLGVERIHAVVSAFPEILAVDVFSEIADDPVTQEELRRLRASEGGHLEAPLRAALIPDDPALRVLSFTSAQLCLRAPEYVRLLGVHCEALPSVEALPTAPAVHRELVERLRTARAAGRRVVLLSMGTIVVRMAKRLDPAALGFVKHLYATTAKAALAQGAIVIAATSDATPAELGVDAADFPSEVHDRLIVMSFVPQPLLFAHGLVDVMLMHGGANTLHEAATSAVPLLVCPVFGDQPSVADAVTRLGLGASVATPRHPGLTDAQPIEQLVERVLPKMLAPGVSAWKAAMNDIAARLREENGLSAAEAIVVGRS